MKKIIILFLIAPILMATQCEDEGCIPSITQKTKFDLITIENLQTNYNVGDIIWLNSSLSRNQEFNETPENIDLFNYQLDFAFGVQFYKLSVYNPEIYLCLDENTTEITQGSLNENLGCNLFVYERTDNQLKCRVGIKLLETGNYKLSINNISNFRETGLTCNDQAIDIYTTFSNNNLQSVNFSVN